MPPPGLPPAPLSLSDVPGLPVLFAMARAMGMSDIARHGPTAPRLLLLPGRRRRRGHRLSGQARRRIVRPHGLLLTALMLQRR